MNGNPTTVVFCCHEYSELIKQQVTFNDISTNGLSISVLAMLMTVFSRCCGFYPIKVHNRKKKNGIENNLHSTWVGFIYLRNRTLSIHVDFLLSQDFVLMKGKTFEFKKKYPHFPTCSRGSSSPFRWSTFCNNSLSFLIWWSSKCRATNSLWTKDLISSISVACSLLSLSEKTIFVIKTISRIHPSSFSPHLQPQKQDHPKVKRQSQRETPFSQVPVFWVFPCPSLNEVRWSVIKDCSYLLQEVTQCMLCCW